MKKILLVDHDASIRQALGEVLTSEGYKVIPAATAGEAVARFLTEQPALILLDLNLPDCDDEDVFDPASGLRPGVPVVIITAKSNARKNTTGVNTTGFNADFVMEKPLDIPLLLNVIHSYLDSAANESVSESPQIGAGPGRTFFGSKDNENESSSL